MPIVVQVVTEAEYKAWVAEQKAGAAAPSYDASKTYSVAELVKAGEAVYNTNCAVCHKPGGEGMPPTFPALTGGKISTGPLAAHVDIVVNGSKKNPMMAAWGGQLNDMDIAAVIAYERNALGNSVGDAPQPGDIAAARN